MRDENEWKEMLAAAVLIAVIAAVYLANEYLHRAYPEPAAVEAKP